MVDSQQMRFGERLAIAAVASAALLLRVMTLFRYRVDSDESQHLHVAWGWSEGLLQYRDIFDNHAPLFHILTSPLFSIFGERTDIVVLARVLMIPLFAIVLACTFAIARRAHSTRAAMWTVVLLSTLPFYFRRSVEYRTDNLWITLWIVLLWYLMRAAPSPRRMFVAGIILGIAMCVSLKTTLFIATLVIAGLAVFIIVQPFSPRRLIAFAGAAIGGFLIAPSIILAWFRHLGILDEMIYCTITFNSLYHHERPIVWVARIFYPIVLAVTFVAARRRAAGGPRIPLLLMTIVAYFMTLLSFWPVIGDRDVIPLAPPLCMLLAVMLLDRFGADAWRRILLPTVLLFCAAVFPLIRQSRMYEQRLFLQEVFDLTDPSDSIMSIKGEHVYRRRPVYSIFEKVTRTHVENGILKDDSPERIIAAGCHVATHNTPLFPPRTRAFLNDNFMDIGRMRVTAHPIGDDGLFTIAIPGEYSVLNPGGFADGAIDGMSLNRRRYLAAGRHLFVHGYAPPPYIFVWSQAADRGFSPFHPRHWR